jgi:hypothetical protein
MPEHPHSKDDSIVNPETQHEESDVNVRALMLFVVIFVVFSAVVYVAVWLMFKFFIQVGKSAPPPAMTQIARPADADVPSLPRLQPFVPGQSSKSPAGTRSPVADTPVADMEKMRAAEEKTLNNAGWVDQQKGVVHIPIEQAKQFALQRGLFPVNTAASAPQAGAPPATAGIPAQGQSSSAQSGTGTTRGTQQ